MQKIIVVSYGTDSNHSFFYSDVYVGAVGKAGREYLKSGIPDLCVKCVYLLSSFVK